MKYGEFNSMDRYSRAILTVIAVFLGWICVRDIPLISSVSGQQPSGHLGKILEAREFRVVDDTGKVRAKLALNPSRKEDAAYEDQPGFYLYRTDGRPSAQFSLSDENGTLVIRDRKSNPCVGIGVAKNQPDFRQGGFVTVSDTNDEGATLGTWIDWKNGAGPASSLKLFSGPTRKVFWEPKLPSTDDERRP